MFYHFFYALSKEISAFNVFRYITFRGFVSFTIAFLASVWIGKKFIKFMQRKQYGQSIRDDGPESHAVKKGTPTMGGVFIFLSMAIAILLSGNFNSMPLLVSIFVGVSFFLLGGLDDYLKILKKNSDGVSAKGKLAWQVITSVIASYLLIENNIMTTELYIPFLKEPICDLGTTGYMIFASIVIVGSSNAVNLTDGLDGLAIGPIMSSSAALGLIAYVSGHAELSNYLLIPYIENSGELLVMVAAIIGAGAGFLWYNSYPAQIFMGDVGSLSLGGVLGIIAVITKSEFLFVIIGGVFVIEALSVILQVGSYKLRKKRIFKMAPIHHHFELLGWHESKVIIRFWIVSIMLALLAIATLKVR